VSQSLMFQIGGCESILVVPGQKTLRSVSGQNHNCVKLLDYRVKKCQSLDGDDVITTVATGAGKNGAVEIPLNVC
jgi:hypothetical protein